MRRFLRLHWFSLPAISRRIQETAAAPRAAVPVTAEAAEKTGGNDGSGSKPRFTLTKTGSTYRLTVSDGVTAVKDNEFNSSSTIITAKADPSLPAVAVVSEIKLPGSLRSIGNGGFKDNQGVTGTLTLPSSLQSIGSSAFGNLGKNHSQAGSAGNSNKAPVIDFGSGSTLKSIGDERLCGGPFRRACPSGQP